MRADDRPQFFLAMGPSGSGKSTLLRTLDNVFIRDKVLQRLSGGKSHGFGLEARHFAREEEQEFWSKNLAGRCDFATERTFRNVWDFELIERAFQAGYHVAVGYIAINDPELLVHRSDVRVRGGGHYVSPQDVREIYEQSLCHLPMLFEAAANGRIQMLALYDSRKPPMCVLSVLDGRVKLNRKVPVWVEKSLAKTLFNVAALRRAERQGLSLAKLSAGERNGRME